MKKILFLHGFYASGQCVPAVALREAFEGRLEVITPDLPIHPKEAVRFIRKLIETEQPDLLIGNSCGAFYAQMVAPVAGIPAVLGNPHFRMTEFLKQRIGEHQYKSPRKDGNQRFIIDEALIKEFAEMEAIQFDNCHPDFSDRIWGLFGEQDTLAHFEPMFLEHYNRSFHFPGGHTPTAEEVRDWYVPLAEKMLVSTNQQLKSFGSSVKLIIFDFDGTLGDTRRTIVNTMQMTIKELQLPSRTEAECASTIGLPLAGCFRTLFPDIQEEFTLRCAETYRRIFNENLQNIKPEAFGGVVKTLKTLKEQGFTLTIASSRSHNSLTELTRDMGIADYISYLIGADDVKAAKPKPEPVLNTLAAMHFASSETLVVGDMAVDILMGANAGAKTCGVTWGNGSRKELEEAGADFIIDSMEEILVVLRT